MCSVHDVLVIHNLIRQSGMCPSCGLRRNVYFLGTPDFLPVSNKQDAICVTKLGQIR